MSLFEVPGWSVPSAPVAQHTKKRKRPSVKEVEEDDEAERIQTAQKNIEKLMHNLGAGLDALDGEDAGRPSKKKRDGGKEKKGKSVAKEDKTKEKGMESGKKQERIGKKNDAPPNQTRGHKKDKDAKVTGPTSGTHGKLDSSPAKGEKQKRKHKREELSDARSDAGFSQGDVLSPSATPSTPHVPPKKPTEKTSKEGQQGLTALQANMKKTLDGARFRWINENLYKSDSAKAHQLMRQDPAVFADYHIGFRHQVQSWPTNPVSYYISALSSYPAKTVIADLGCGDAALARVLVPKGMTVLSFDLVSDNAYVIEADTCARVPLPGAEKLLDGTNDGEEEGEGQIVDVVVCALSLMGTNWPGCIREAWRILRPGGELKVAEVTSRFTNVGEFTSFVSSFGFKLKSKDERNTHFTLFDFKKVSRKPKNEEAWTKLMSRGSILKPCEYKRR